MSQLVPCDYEGVVTATPPPHQHDYQLYIDTKTGPHTTANTLRRHTTTTSHHRENSSPPPPGVIAGRSDATSVAAVLEGHADAILDIGECEVRQGGVTLTQLARVLMQLLARARSGYTRTHSPNTHKHTPSHMRIHARRRLARPWRNWSDGRTWSRSTRWATTMRNRNWRAIQVG